ncbi:MAG: carbamoyltransferase HypF [Acidimicrobiales bacterium]|nr:carbamoyltransferase HypF [Acidimicrobiales bacterium]RZV45220.1 MAG: carbamoyltransferase HypF [Acidimicrobiales bacterium]
MRTERRRLHVRGVVQGVGFRPFVHHLAEDCVLAGFVRNETTRVCIEVEGPGDALDLFSSRLLDELPRLARIDSINTSEIDRMHELGFRIERSGAIEPGTQPSLIPPDTAVCPDCVRELFDPEDRRHRHPFITCTNCGPRFTIIDALPYDRPNTTMRGFPMCERCAGEYSDATDRRHHAQPVACPHCGPQLTHEREGHTTAGTDSVLAEVHADLEGGLVVAIKGLGGYHLAVDATSDDAVAQLRARKGRAHKPFAVMVPDLDAARRVAEVDEDEAAVLSSATHPIVLLRAKKEASLSLLVAPGNPLVGVMLPYTPVHHLLFAQVPGSPTRPPSAVVMTSGNLSEEPICFDDDDARTRLAAIADSFCLHDRPIHIPCDDSVVRVLDGVELPIRRSRGYAPLPVSLPVSMEPTLAVGGELKNTFALANGPTAWLSQHLGDMENHETLMAFESSFDRLSHMYAVRPKVVAVDPHPGYQTQRWATRYADLQGNDISRVEVQHHHAHLASLMAEHGLDGTEPVIGFVFDGTGFGSDGTMWGGEVLVGDYHAVERWGHLRNVPLPGGDSAAHNPCRTALAHLRAAEIPWSADIASVQACDETELAVLGQQLDAMTNCVQTSSMGRLFDAVASLLDLRHRITYEAHAAIDLEVLADEATECADLHFELDADGTLDPAPLLQGLVDGLAAGVDRAALAAGFHIAVVEAMVTCAVRIRTESSINVVGLTGGVFQNVLLAHSAMVRLRELGFVVLTHRVVPPNDGGIALGQLLVAAHRHHPAPTTKAEGREPLCV